MRRLRDLLLRHPALVAWLFATALCVRLAVPGGFMLSSDGGSVRLTLCDSRAMQPPPAVSYGHEHGHGGHPKDPAPPPDAPCAFTAVAWSLLDSDGPVLPRIPEFSSEPAVALALLPAEPPQARLRPPQTGPPHCA